MIVCQANQLTGHGHKVVIRTSRVDTHFVCDDGVVVQLSGSRTVPSTLLDLCRMSDDFDFLVVDIIPLAVLAGLRFGRRRVIYYCQDWDVSYYKNPFPRYFIRFLYWVEKTFFRMPVIVVADHLLDKIGRRGVPPAFVVENGINPITFNANSRERPSCSSSVLSILLFLRKDQRKGTELALALIKRLASNYTGRFRVVSVGESCPENVPGIEWDHHGTVDENRLNQLLNSSDLFLYPSRHEGFPLMAVEAFACRCLLVTTRAVPFAKDRYNALVADVDDLHGLYDRLCAVMDGQVDVDLLVRNAADFAARHSMSVCTENFVKVIEELGE